MIVFISDLHFEDGTAGKHNVSADAFCIFFDELRRHVDRRGVEKLEIVLLGDIFDLLRTRYWFGVDPGERPWGDPGHRGSALARHAGAVLARIEDRNAPTFDRFRTEVESLRKNGLEVDVTYVPGNHDRLINLHPSLRSQTRKILGLGDTTDAFAERIARPSHGVVALHGHQFDVYNTEPISASNPDGVPIGDPITTELVARLPCSVLAAIKERAPATPEKELECIERDFESIEDVRPMWAAVDWLLSHVRNQPQLEYAVHRGLDDALSKFRAIPYVKSWFDEHDRWTDVDDEADRLKWLMMVAGAVPLKLASKLAPAAVKVADLLTGPDPYVGEAETLFKGADLQTHFVVMGHTHKAKQQAVSVMSIPGGPMVQRVYLNTGTWRPCHYRCSDGGGFLAWREMTFTMVYAPHERSGYGAPSFETWSGTLAQRDAACDS